MLNHSSVSEKASSLSRIRNIKLAIGLNILFTLIELIGGLFTNSLAILSDALHDFGDSLILILSLFAEKYSNRVGDTSYTFGYRRFSLLSALFSGVVLISGSVFILLKAIPRIITPKHVNASGMFWLAILGILLNSIGASRLLRGKSQNEKILSWHLLEDVFGWVVILVGSVFMIFSDNHVIDPVMTVGFSLFVVIGVLKNIKDTLHIFLEGVPSDISIDSLYSAITGLNGIMDIHDVHLWSLDGNTNIFSAHIVVSPKDFQDSSHVLEIRNRVKNVLHSFGIVHGTLEIEPSNTSECDTSCSLKYL